MKVLDVTEPVDEILDTVSVRRKVRIGFPSGAVVPLFPTEAARDAAVSPFPCLGGGAVAAAPDATVVGVNVYVMELFYSWRPVNRSGHEHPWQFTHAVMQGVPITEEEVEGANAFQGHIHYKELSLTPEWLRSRVSANAPTEMLTIDVPESLPENFA